VSTRALAIACLLLRATLARQYAANAMARLAVTPANARDRRGGRAGSLQSLYWRKARRYLRTAAALEAHAEAITRGALEGGSL